MLASLLMFVVVLSSLGFVFASNNNVPPGASPASAGGTMTFSGEGQYAVFLTHAITSLSDRGLYTVKLTTRLDLTIIVIDCCVQGDTIALFNPTPTNLLAYAKSPVIIKGTWSLSPGTYPIYVGYTSSPGGFPAGYYIYFITSAYGGGYPAAPRIG